MPRFLHCSRAAATNSVVETLAVGTPFSSKYATSCELHEIHDPHELTASTTPWQRERMSCRTSGFAMRAGEGLA